VILQAEGLRAGYAGSEVLHGIDLTVGENEGVVVLGPNGHGKTTLLRSITGLLPRTAGSLSFAGQDISNWRADQIAAAGMIHIPQGDLLFPDMTVEENLLMGAYVKPAWTDRSGRLDKVLEMLPQLADRRRQLAHSLSGGERRMLAIGRGLMGEAKLLIVDEPSLGLAPVIIEQVYASIQAVKDAGLAILLADENAEHVEGLADRVLLLETGMFVREGPASELLRDEALLSVYLG